MRSVGSTTYLSDKVETPFHTFCTHAHEKGGYSESTSTRPRRATQSPERRNHGRTPAERFIDKILVPVQDQG